MTVASKTPTKSVSTKAASSRSTAIKSKTNTPKPPASALPTQSTDPSVPQAAAVTPSVVDKLSPVLVSNDLRKKELFDLVVARSGMKKKDVKPVVEAMLAVLGDALSEQREMNLQPLGRLKVQRAKELGDGRALVLKLRQKTAQLNAAPKTPGESAD